jgi:hypothetical protein
MMDSCVELEFSGGERDMVEIDWQYQIDRYGYIYYVILSFFVPSMFNYPVVRSSLSRAHWVALLLAILRCAGTMLFEKSVGSPTHNCLTSFLQRIYDSSPHTVVPKSSSTVTSTLPTRAPISKWLDQILNR